jgi:hypothetical protein
MVKYASVSSAAALDNGIGSIGPIPGGVNYDQVDADQHLSEINIIIRSVIYSVAIT